MTLTAIYFSSVIAQPPKSMHPSLFPAGMTPLVFASLPCLCIVGSVCLKMPSPPGYRVLSQLSDKEVVKSMDSVCLAQYEHFINIIYQCY